MSGIVTLGLAYVLSQFFRAFLAVLAGPLAADIGADASDLAQASGFWFLTFALMQIPMGAALDRLGPARTASVLLALGGGGGAALFGMATAPWHLSAGMVLIGVGCSPVLMAAYYIFAREYSPARFATLAALILGLGSVGNLLSAYPMALAVDLIGWRAAMGWLSGMCIAVALGIVMLVRDPAPVTDGAKGSVLDLLRMPVLWPIFVLMFVNYAPAGAIRGLWIGPYLGDAYGFGPDQIGVATLVMGCAMIAGTLIYGPLDRLLGTRKWVVFAGNMIAALATLALAVGTMTGASAVQSIALMALIGLTGAAFPVILAHARAFFPAHLTGRGVTLINLFGIGGVGIMQFASGGLHSTVAANAPALAYPVIFAFFGGALLIGTLIYLASRDSMD